MRRLSCNWFGCAGALLTIFFSADAAADGLHSAKQKAVEETVRVFCEFEFNGAEDTGKRKELIHFSDDTFKKLSRLSSPMDPYAFMFESDPMDVVDSFDIVNVEVTSNKAVAIVKYTLIARREAMADDIRKVTKSDMIVQFRLELIDGRWMLIDPLPPRVSRQYVSQAYRQKFVMRPDWYESARSGQWRELRKYIDIILLLEE